MKHAFSAQIEELHSMLQWIRDQLADSFDRKTLARIELAGEEALVNIIQHAYQNLSGTIEIEVAVFPNIRAEITIRDYGPPFDLLKNEPIDPSLSLEERKIGGLGIHFIQECMDEVHYRRESNMNILTLIKKTTRSSQTK